MYQIDFNLNGVAVSAEVSANLLLIDYIREHQKLTGTHTSCDTSQCGACVVHVNGASVKSCSLLAVGVDGCDVTTIEGLAKDGQLHPVQQAFIDHLGLQCGYCTPGMIMAAVDILRRHASPDEQTIRHELKGNYCRCTGYQNIVQAILAVAEEKTGAQK